MAAVSPRRPEGGGADGAAGGAGGVGRGDPDGATFAQASTLPMNGLTAELALDLLACRAGETLAVTGGAGLLASYVIALAKEQGLRVIADAKPGADTSSSARSAPTSSSARASGFAAAVLEAAPGGADGLIDTAVLGRGARAIRDGGQIVVVRGWNGGELEDAGSGCADVRREPCSSAPTGSRSCGSSPRRPDPAARGGGVPARAGRRRRAGDGGRRPARPRRDRLLAGGSAPSRDGARTF